MDRHGHKGGRIMKQAAHKLQWNERLNEPAVDQGIENGWHLSWNPDDGRFYVGGEHGIATATFKEWRNAVRYARTHQRKGQNE
jgi:hypothetical protein